MSKLSIYLMITTGSLFAIAELPLFFLFGIVFVGIRIELGTIQKKAYPIISNLILSAIIGWASSFGVKHFFPSLFIGDVKIFSMFITTLFAYVVILYLYKNQTIQKIIVNLLHKKVNNDDNNNDNNIGN